MSGSSQALVTWINWHFCVVPISHNWINIRRTRGRGWKIFLLAKPILILYFSLFVSTFSTLLETLLFPPSIQERRKPNPLKPNKDRQRSFVAAPSAHAPHPASHTASPSPSVTVMTGSALCSGGFCPRSSRHGSPLAWLLPVGITEASERGCGLHYTSLQCWAGGGNQRPLLRKALFLIPPC